MRCMIAIALTLTLFTAPASACHLGKAARGVKAGAVKVAKFVRHPFRKAAR